MPWHGEPGRLLPSFLSSLSEVPMATCVEHSLQEITASEIVQNAAPARLYELAVSEEGAAIVASGALATYSGEKTGRSPKDKRIVENPESKGDVWWGSVNMPVS